MVQKKTAGVLITLLIFLCGLTGCSDTKPKTTGQIQSIEVNCMAENDAQIYQVNYPYSYTVFNKEKRRCDTIDLTNATEIEKLTKEEFVYFTEYIKKLAEMEKEDTSENPAYKIIYHYYDENGESQDMYIYGPEYFPEGFGEFLERFNQICGGNYLTCEGTIQTVTPAFLTEAFGVTDEDVKEGSLQDVIDLQKLDMVDVVDRMFDMDAQIYRYYADLKESKIKPYRPYEIQSVESSQEEYDAIVDAYLEILGTDTWEEVESDQDYLRCLRTTHRNDLGTFSYVYMGKTTDLEEMYLSPPTWEGDYYQMELDAHMEDMTMLTDFVYSRDGKFILVGEAVTDHILAFIEL